MRMREAFTLVELLIVMAILATLAGIAMPRYSAALANYRADAAARRICADLAMAKARAISTSTAQTVTFTTASNQYQLVGFTDPVRPAMPYVISLGDRPYEATFGDINLGGTYSVVFNGHGENDVAGTIQVRAGTAVRTVRLIWAHGSTSIE